MLLLIEAGLHKPCSTDADVGVVQYASTAGASAALTKMVAAAAKKAIKARGAFTIALTGGRLTCVCSGVCLRKDSMPNLALGQIEGSEKYRLLDAVTRQVQGKAKPDRKRIRQTITDVVSGAHAAAQACLQLTQ